ncbi:kinase-like domain-containing protein [Phycomyces blakesleeanus]|uniref:Kinase-like domain-containing protein n=1 Tax=Phycomyces blakesleeanus TaxID=4837 RepID=A0ABR3ALH9_PHYBL
MTQKPLNTPQTFAKLSTPTFDQPASPSHRARSSSLMRVVSHHNAPLSNGGRASPTIRRSMSISDGQQRSTFYHHDPSSEISQATSSTPTLAQVSETNWANRIEDFDMKHPIGYGSSAVVYEAVYKPLNKRVAIKILDLDMFERNQIDELRRETALMALSKHPNVLRVYGSFVSGSKLYIVTPYLSAGSCLDIMKTSFPDGFEETTIATILKQALEGLAYIHKNGHIHRDVKCGNLLMDEQGTVMLADFGVSSSLSENGDKRKTFVGTPCWMAPEVMEQSTSGYDYKADIWSFGITCIELATGHAPFAKYPPLKVLMMTINKDPPTLNRDTTRHKYSKGFKEMIDSCLQKDPTKRPSAEKLLQHPFFKQAKKKDHLIKAVLAHVSPLEQRPHKKMPLKQISFQTTEQWDFDTQSDSEGAQSDKSQLSVDAPPPARKHITFGDVVIRDPVPRASHGPVVESPPYSPQTTISSQTPKKSRFVVDDGREDSSSSAASVPTAVGPTPSLITTPILSSTPSGSDAAYPGTGSDVGSPTTIESPSVGLGIMAHQTPQEGEVRKGRFSVNQTPRSMSEDSNDAPHKSTSPPPQEKSTPQVRFETFPISRESSHSSVLSLSRESLNGKVSRFSVEKEQGKDSASLPHPQIETSVPQPIPPECRKKGRFELTGGQSAPLTPIETSRIDREVCGDSSQSSLIGSPSTSPCNSLLRGQSTLLDAAKADLMKARMEELLRYTETQRVLLHDAIQTLNSTPSHPALPSLPTSYPPSTPTSILVSRSRASSDTRKSANNDPLELSEFQNNKSSSLSHEISSTVEHLQHLLLISNKEKEKLTKENDALRKEIERLRQK